MGIRPRITFENVNPKLDGGYKNIGLVDAIEGYTITPYIGAPQSPPDLSKDQWLEFSLSLSILDMIGENDIKNYNDFLKFTNKVTKGMVALIKIVRLLSSDLKSLNRVFKFAIKQIVVTLKDLINSFVSTGMYFTVITPKQSENDPGYTVPTWGDFNEFKSVIIGACTDYSDKGSPSQLSYNAKVGGFVIGGVGGASDPQIIDLLIYNMRALANLFPFKPSLPGPPRNLVAQEGIYQTGEKDNSGSKEMKPGIKLTWHKPDSYILAGFYIFRSMNKSGDFPTLKQMDAIIANSALAKDQNLVRSFQKIKIFDNDANADQLGLKKFNEGEPVFVGKNILYESYEYTDFEVQTGTKYYYRVYTVLNEKKNGLSGDPYLFRVDSPMSSNEASATAYNCIPVSEIPNGILTLDGEWIDEKDHSKSKWSSLAIKDLLGPSIEKLLNAVDKFADKLIGYVSTSSDAVNEYLDAFAKKIDDYVKILDILTQVINVIMSFRLKGSVLLLNLTKPKEGGIQGFAQRIANATVNSAILGKKPRSESEIVNINVKVPPGAEGAKSAINSQVSNDMGASLSALKGFYYGLVVVYGFTDKVDLKAYAAPYMTEYNDVSSQLANNEKTINMLLKILLGKKG